MAIKIGHNLSNINNVITQIGGNIQDIKKVVTLKNGLIKIIWEQPTDIGNIYIVPTNINMGAFETFIADSTEDLNLIFVEGTYYFVDFVIKNQQNNINFIGNNTVFSGNNIANGDSGYLFKLSDNLLIKFTNIELVGNKISNGILVENTIEHNSHEREFAENYSVAPRSRTYDEYNNLFIECIFRNWNKAINITKSHLLTIQRCKFYNNVYPTHIVMDSYIYGSGNYVIQNNMFKNNTRPLSIHGNNIYIQNNDIYNSYNQGLFCKGHYMFINNNNILNNWDTGIKITSYGGICNIHSNDVSKSSGHGLWLTIDAKDESNNISIMNNRYIKNNYTPLRIEVSGTSINDKILIGQNGIYHKSETYYDFTNCTPKLFNNAEVKL